MIPYPISEVNVLIDTARPQEIAERLRAFLLKRLAAILPGEGARWKCLQRRDVITEERLIELALGQAQGRAHAGQGTTVELWIGGEDGKSVPGRWLLAEKWEVTFELNKLPLMVLSLDLAGAHDYLNRSGLSWCERHLAFCCESLKEGVFDCIWNQFEGDPHFDCYLQKNEYWGRDFFLREAVRRNALFTDMRDESQKVKILKTLEISNYVTEILGFGTDGGAIIRLTDTPESLTAFESRVENGGDKF